MEIRFLEETDSLLDISHIYEASWKYAYKDIIPQDYLDSIPSGQWAPRLTSDGKRNLICIENDNIIGTASIRKSRWKSHADYGEIIAIYFLPEYIGKGYGKMLFSRCVEELKQMGFSKIMLWVLEDNMRARRFYEKNGFHCADEYLDDCIGGKNLREVMYILE
ncbi:MAG: GNAT family N-acetyltransferase [bacterium]|nr:GNAT family N-acetyltransferase [bacterium]